MNITSWQVVDNLEGWMVEASIPGEGSIIFVVAKDEVDKISGIFYSGTHDDKKVLRWAEREYYQYLKKPQTYTLNYLPKKSNVSLNILPLYKVSDSTKLSWQVQEDNFDRIETNEFGIKKYYKGDKYHRLDGPAIEWLDGDKFWYVNDKLHRLDGPAVEYANGNKAWWVNGKLHRLDGPAIEYTDGHKEWYINGKNYSEKRFNEKVKELNKLSWIVQEDNFDNIKTNAFGSKYYYKGADLHRLDGPAIEFSDGSNEWFVNDRLHRLDGPAVEHSDGHKEWWIDGDEYTEEEFNEAVKELNKLSWQVLEDNFDRIDTDDYGTRYYYKGNKYHRLDGPAIEWSNGSKSWWVNGKLHRLDGPAIDYVDGYKAWYIDGEEYTEEEFNEKVKELNKLSWQVLEDNFDRIETNEFGDTFYFKGDDLHRLDGPAIDLVDGTKLWYQNGERHRTDGPAIERADGSKSWYQNGRLHREDGPAIEYPNMYKAWYIDGVNYSEKEFNEKVKELNKLSWQVLEDNFDRIETNEFGDTFYFKGDDLHRLDGPAIERADGSKSWYQNDKLHRLDGPSIEYANGAKFWHQNGKRHRLDGPAVEYPNMYKAWYIDGVNYSEKEFNNKVRELENEKEK